jgi:hypothetical protein
MSGGCASNASTYSATLMAGAVFDGASGKSFHPRFPAIW